MKTRNDFVSNSSSCSFVIALPENFRLDEFVRKTAAGCIKHASPNEMQFAQEQDGLNKAVLHYHLRISELLFLGLLTVGKARSEFSSEDEYFKQLKSDISEGRLSPDEKVVENSDSRIVLEFDDKVGGMALPKHEIPYITTQYHWNGDFSEDPEKQKEAADQIVDFAKIYSDYSGVEYEARADSNTYFISRRTIWNTRALIAAGKNIELEPWMDLDKLDGMLAGGALVFGVRVSNGGDGVSEDSVYTFGGWDGEDLFNNMDGIQVLDTETL